jgi:hypothetical protein
MLRVQFNASDELLEEMLADNGGDLRQLLEQLD